MVHIIKTESGLSMVVLLIDSTSDLAGKKKEKERFCVIFYILRLGTNEV